MSRTSPTFRRRRLARRIRQLREQAGLTQDSAAAGLDMSTSALSRKETGEVATSVHEIRSMMDLYDHYDAELVDLARAARAKGWWRAYGIEDRGYFDLETEARIVREFALAFIPGLLQTREYMTHLFRTGDAARSEQFVAKAVTARLARCEILTGADPLDYRVVLDEACLRRPVASREVMRRQLQSLVKQTELDTIDLRVLPASHGVHSGMESAFCLLSYADDDEPDVLYLEHIAGSHSTSKSKDVERAHTVFDEVHAAALNPGSSVALIGEVADQL